MNFNNDAKFSGGRTIDYVVDSFLNEAADYDTMFRDRFAQMAIECVQFELQVQNLPNVKVAYLPIGDSGTVKFPSDMVKYTKIGVDMWGRWWTLTLNRDLMSPRVQECGEDISAIKGFGNVVPDVYSAGYAFTDHYDSEGRFVGGLFGLGGGLNIGYYNIDEARRLIILSPNIPRKQLVVEYVASGVSTSTVVPSECVQVIKQYIRWKRDIDDPRVPLSTKENAETLFYREIEKLRSIKLTFLLNEYMDSLYQESIRGVNR